MVGSSAATIATGANVIFNSIVNNPSANIVYNGATGEFTITESGNYFISWWVNTDGAQAESSITFSIAVQGGATISASSPSPDTTLQLNGNALITVTAPAVVSLISSTGAPVTLGTSAVQADLVIIHLSD